MKALQGKIALVTGVGRPEGIGAAICRKLASEGADIFYTYWHAYDLEDFPTTGSPEKLAIELRGFGVRVESAEIDLSQEKTPRELFQKTIAMLGCTHILVNNACYDRSVPFTEMTAALLDKHYAVNIRATTLLCVEFMKAWREKRGGRIINLTSGQSYGPMNVEQIPYTITKAGLEMLAKQLAPSLKTLGVTINAIDPGPTDTGWMSKQLKEKLKKESVVNQPDEVANAIFLFLLDNAEDKTGQVVHVGR